MSEVGEIVRSRAGDLGRKAVELLEELLIRRFSTLSRGEVRAMFKLEDIRKTRVWQEAHGEGCEEERKKIVRKFVAKGLAPKKVAELMEISAAEVRRLAKDA